MARQLWQTRPASSAPGKPARQCENEGVNVAAAMAERRRRAWRICSWRRHRRAVTCDAATWADICGRVTRQTACENKRHATAETENRRQCRWRRIINNWPSASKLKRRHGNEGRRKSLAGVASQSAMAISCLSAPSYACGVSAEMTAATAQCSKSCAPALAGSKAAREASAIIAAAHHTAQYTAASHHLKESLKRTENKCGVCRQLA